MGMDDDIGARLDVLEVLVCHAMTKGDPALARQMAEWFQGQGEHLIRQSPEDRRAWAGLRLGQILEREIAATQPHRT